MRYSFLTALLSAGLAIGCGSSTETTSTPPAVVDQTPTSIAATGTIATSGSAGLALSTPVVVKVLNRSGAPVGGATVTFRVVAGGGLANPASAATDALGTATTTWTLGTTAGTQSLTAAVGELAPVTFTTRAIAAAASIAKFTGDAQSAAAGTAVTTAPAVRLVDASGNPVGDVTVTFAVASGGGSVAGGSAITGADGVARAGGWTLGTKAGANTLQATAGASLVTTFTANGVPGATRTLTLDAQLPTELRMDDRVNLRPKAIDGFGNENTTAPITFTVTPAGAASVDSTGSLVALAAGTFSVRAASGSATATYSANVTGHPTGTTVAASFDVGAAPKAVTVVDDGIWALNTTVYPRQLVHYSFDGAQLSAPVPIEHVATDFYVLAPAKGGSTVVVVSTGQVSSSYWFIDIATNAKIDSLTTQRYAQFAGMSADGRRAYFLLDAGELKVYDTVLRDFLPSIALGGGITGFKIAYGDSLAYVTTSVGTMVEVDLVRGGVKRQYSMRTYTDLDVSRDLSLFYVADPQALFIRVLRTSDLTQVGSVIFNGGRLAIAPDMRALYGGTATAFGPQLVTFTGTAGAFARGTTYNISLVASRLLFNSSGSVLVVVMANGMVNVIR